jgi:hypothetical protein
MAGKDEIEMRWIDAWSDLYQLIEEYHDGVNYAVWCLLPDGSVVDIEKCLGWLQDSAYDDWYLKVERGWVWGKPGILVSRTRDNCN